MWLSSRWRFGTVSLLVFWLDTLFWLLVSVFSWLLFPPTVLVWWCLYLNWPSLVSIGRVLSSFSGCSGIIVTFCTILFWLHFVWTCVVLSILDQVLIRFKTCRPSDHQGWLSVLINTHSIQCSFLVNSYKRACSHVAWSPSMFGTPSFVEPEWECTCDQLECICRLYNISPGC